MFLVFFWDICLFLYFLLIVWCISGVCSRFLIRLWWCDRLGLIIVVFRLWKCIWRIWLIMCSVCLWFLFCFISLCRWIGVENCIWVLCLRIRMCVSLCRCLVIV